MSNWFELKDVDVNFSRFNDFEELRKGLKKARVVEKDSWSLSYIDICSKLIFNGKLNTPNGEIDTEFVYYMKSDLNEFIKEAKVDIYEQTFTGLDLAVTVKFSSGSIISKIVFGDIEKAYIQLKEEVSKIINEYNEKVKGFNKEIDKLIEEKNESEEDE